MVFGLGHDIRSCDITLKRGNMSIKNFFKIMLTVFSPFIIAACNNSVVKKITPVVVPATPSAHAFKLDIQGSWVSGCKYSQVYRTNITQTLTYIGKTSEVVTKYYPNNTQEAKNTCNDANYQTHIFNEIVFGKVINRGTADQYTKINIIAKKALITALKPAMVTFLNDETLDIRQLIFRNELGTDNTITWLLNKPQNLTIEYTRDKLHGFGAPPVLEIYQVSANTISFGDKNGNLDEDKRPIMLDTTSRYTRPVSQ